MTTAIDRFVVQEENAHKAAKWLRTRGGIAEWKSHDLSNPGAGCFTPALTDGKPTPSPHWRYTGNPKRVITDPNDIAIVESKEVERFKVKLQMKGHRIELTKRSTNMVLHAMSCYPDGSWHFASTGSGSGSLAHGLNYGEDCVVVTVPDKTTPLSEHPAWTNHKED